MVELLTTHHSLYAVVALYDQYQEGITRVAGPGPTILVFISAVLALYDQYQDQEEITRVAGPGPTILVFISAVLALYDQ